MEQVCRSLAEVVGTGLSFLVGFENGVSGGLGNESPYLLLLGESWNDLSAWPEVSGMAWGTSQSTGAWPEESALKSSYLPPPSSSAEKGCLSPGTTKCIKEQLGPDPPSL